MYFLGQNSLGKQPLKNFFIIKEIYNNKIPFMP